MPKATRKTTTSNKTNLMPDPSFAAIENHRKTRRGSFSPLRSKRLNSMQQKNTACDRRRWCPGAIITRSPIPKSSA